MRKQTRGIGTYIIILGIIALVMFLSDNLYKMNRSNYNLENLKTDLKNKAVAGIDIYQNQATPTGEVEVAIGQNKDSRTGHEWRWRCRQYQDDEFWKEQGKDVI